MEEHGSAIKTVEMVGPTWMKFLFKDWIKESLFVHCPPTFEHFFFLNHPFCKIWIEGLGLIHVKEILWCGYPE